MKHITTILFILLSICVNAQQHGMFSLVSQSVTPPAGEVYYDPFDYSSGTNLSGQGGWTTVTGAIIRSAAGAYAQGNSGGAQSLYYKDSVLTNDQLIQGLFTYSSGVGGVGVVGRYNAGVTCYLYYVENNLSTLYRVSSGTPTVLGTNNATGLSTATIRMEIEGSTIRCYLNGNLDTGLNGTGIFTDTNIPTGNRAGVYTYNNAAVYLDNWTAQDL